MIAPVGLIVFQSTPPAQGATALTVEHRKGIEFQSTPPRRGRPAERRARQR